METINLSQLGGRMSANAGNGNVKDLPVWEKTLLTVVEAAKYFQIGENNIRRITKEYADADFVYWRDNTRVYIRREAFERFLDKQKTI